jgi:parallel beta-helix repeat protein
MKLVHAVILISVLCFFGSWFIPSALAATVYVAPTGSNSNSGASWTLAKQTVGAGLTAAVSGDQVWVAAGTYNERITLTDGVALYGGFAGTETDLSQQNFTNNQTILDGQAGGSVVTSPAGATATTRIDGFTIRNGTGTYFSGTRYGGGIYCRHSSPTISNNTISQNSVEYDGGGIYCCDSSPTINNNTISENRAYYGGGIYCDEGASPIIGNNKISGNIAIRSGGGGIYCDYSSPTISNNTIDGNSTNYDGGGIYCFDSFPIITNNIISGNSAEHGGGIYCYYHSSPTISNNTIVGNNAGYGGGGIYSCMSSSPIISNNVIAFNQGGIYGGASVLRNNCVFNPPYKNYSDLSVTPTDIQHDPLFVDLAGGDFHLTYGSPCINAGNDADVQAGWVDMDGQARIIGSHVDIGADEGVPPVPGDANLDRRVNVGDLGILAAHYGIEFDATWAMGDFNGDEDVDIGDLGILAAHYGEGVSGVVNFDADCAKAFGTTTEQDDSAGDAAENADNDSNGLVCSGLGLPLIAGLFLAGLLLSGVTVRE